MTEKQKKILAEGGLALGVTLDEKKLSNFGVYLDEIKKWNEKMNLTSITEETEIVTRHFLDSLTPLSFLTGIEKVLDIGSGAGFPGIPLKIAAPSMGVTLMESTEKKIFFLRHIIRTLQLPIAETLFARAEDKAIISMRGGAFGWVISRALSGIDAFLAPKRGHPSEELAPHLMRGWVGGEVFTFSENAETMLEQVQHRVQHKVQRRVQHKAESF